MGGGLGVKVDVNEELIFWGKLKKNIFFWGGWVWGVRVDVNEELIFWGKFTKKIGWGRGSGGGGQVCGVVRVDVNAMLGVGGDVGYGGCEPRIEGIVQCTKRYCTILRKLSGGEGEGQYLNPKHSLCI